MQSAVWHQRDYCGMGNTMTTVHIRRAGITDLKPLASLFNDYLLFYGRPDNLAGAQQFLGARITVNESVIFLAEIDGQIQGFVQLYPTWSSLSLAQSFVLYDLFVAPAHRRSGIATQLLNAATDYAIGQGASGLSLQTHISNHKAQALYESLGWVRDVEFYSYYWNLP
ncbi:GNAT family N-acetyltransferase [Permianibacter fluminis]|uniref:GNAT family N-acetyltransferase n=1 Tax=Permianibacter fluminis TaxID=2738515 RepID=UPI002E2DC305|nr:GNAT family N-acetyltransferase [Permianibacter fluminis]